MAWEIAKGLMTSSLSVADYKTHFLHKIISHSIQHQIKHPTTDSQGDYSSRKKVERRNLNPVEINEQVEAEKVNRQQNVMKETNRGSRWSTQF